MKPVAATVAIAVLTLLALVAPPSASAAPAQLPDTGGPLRLELTQLAPRVVSADGPAVLTVTGTLTNTGREPVDELEVRIQRGDPLTTEGELRDALEGSAGTDAVTPQFASLPGELAPGGQLPIRLAVPLRGAPENSLALAATGVHELLVNVNGRPLDGARARLAAVRLLLPVLSLPPEAGTPGGLGEDEAGEAVPFALLYPIADTPRRLSTVPGELPLLTDDDLAASFAPDGRLGGLVAALAEVAPVGSRVRDATCLAIDADLVETAAVMSAGAGYLVLGDGGAPVAGGGAEVARRWLDALVAVARDGCVIALPYADADLVALTRGGLGELAAGAIVDGRRSLADILGTPVVPGVTWPAEGLIDEPTLERAATADGRALLLSADGIEQGAAQRTTAVVPVAGDSGSQLAVLTDPLLGLAAAGPAEATEPRLGSGVGAASAGTVTALSTQDVIGSLAFRTGVGAPAGDGPLVLAPPHQWAVEGTGARALLGAVDQLIGAGRIVPRALDPILATGLPATPRAVSTLYPIGAGGRTVPSAVVDIVRRTSSDVTDLRSAAVPDTGVGASPEQVFAPLTRGLVRPVSTAWRGRPTDALEAATAGADRIGALRASVRVLEPPSPYSLGTSDAPILLTVENGLPVTVRVLVEIAPSSGLRVSPIEPPQVPPLGRRQVRVDAEVTRAGQFTVQASVRTPDGELLGPPSRLRVRSTAYGTITVWLTASAGALLVVLAARRVLRRVRSEPDGRPEPGLQEPGPPPPPRPDPRRVPPPGAEGDPFPDPLAATDRLPAARPRPRTGNRRRPPGPPSPRVPSP